MVETGEGLQAESSRCSDWEDECKLARERGAGRCPKGAPLEERTV